MILGYTTAAVEKWKLEQLISIINEFEDDVYKKLHHRLTVGENYENIFAHICGKSLLTSREVITLCANGYPDGALSLARNLFEQMILVEFFEHNKQNDSFEKYVSDFFLDYEYQRNKHLKTICKMSGNEQDINKYNDAIRQIKEKAGCSIQGDYWWCEKRNFFDLIETVINHPKNVQKHSLFCMLYGEYKRACVALHASCMGNAIRVGSYENLGVIDTAPTLNGQEIPLYFITTTLISIFGYACENFGIDFALYQKQLNEMAIFYRKHIKIQRLNNIRK